MQYVHTWLCAWQYSMKWYECLCVWSVLSITTKSPPTTTLNSWTSYYPNMIQKRFKPGVVTHGDHVIVIGGLYERVSRKFHDSTEMMNWRQKSTCREVLTKQTHQQYTFNTHTHTNVIIGHIRGLSSTDWRLTHIMLWWHSEDSSNIIQEWHADSGVVDFVAYPCGGCTLYTVNC